MEGGVLGFFWCGVAMLFFIVGWENQTRSGDL
jgi:hypothetical protein